MTKGQLLARSRTTVEPDSIYPHLITIRVRLVYQSKKWELLRVIVHSDMRRSPGSAMWWDVARCLHQFISEVYRGLHAHV